jgi:hypothetical protein
MPDLKNLPVGDLDAAQATALSALVEMEARWENLRAAVPNPGAPPTTLGLQGKQKAYDAFRARLGEYNKRYKPPHVPEQLLNTPIRLGRWCEAMRNLYVRIELDPQGHSPVQLLEKAYRWADRVADRLGKSRITRAGAASTIRAAIAELEALSRWCADLETLAAAA